MSQNSTAVLSSAHITNLEVANNIRINNEALLTGELKTGENISCGVVGQNLVSRGPDKSPEWSSSGPTYDVFDLCIIGAGESGITALQHAVKNCDPSKKIVLITDGSQQHPVQFYKSWISFPQNLPKGDLQDVIVKISDDGSIIGTTQGGFSVFNIGGNSYRNKLDNINSYRWSNDSDPNDPGNQKGGFDFGAWQIKQVGGYANINGGNAGSDPEDYVISKAAETWNGISTGLKEDNLDDELKTYLEYYPNLRQRPVKLEPGESYPATEKSVNNYIDLSNKIEDALKSSSQFGIKDTSYSIEKDNFFVSGRKNWTQRLFKLQQENSNVTIIYNTEVDRIVNGDQEIKTLIANNKQFRLLVRKIVIAGGQIGTTKLVGQLAKDNLKLFNGIKPLLPYRENVGQVVLLFLANSNPDLMPSTDSNKRSIVVARELYNAGVERQLSPTVEVQILNHLDLLYEPHLLRLLGLIGRLDFPTVENLFTKAESSLELKGLIGGLQMAIFFYGQKFLDVSKIRDKDYESELGLSDAERQILYDRWLPYTWNKNIAIKAALKAAQDANDTIGEAQLTQLIYIFENYESVSNRCIPCGWLTISGAIFYQPSVLTALTGNVGNIIEHDDTLEREFILDENSVWNNERREDSNAREFRLIQDLIGTKVKYRAHDFENTKLSGDALDYFKEEYVKTSKETFKSYLIGPNSPKFNILKNISLGHYNIIDEFGGKLGFSDWVADNSELPNNMNSQQHNWYITEKVINFNDSTDEWILNMQQNIQTVWHATQHCSEIVNHLTNKIKNLNNIWIGDQCAWQNLTTSSSAILSSMMAIRAINDICKND